MRNIAVVLTLCSMFAAPAAFAARVLVISIDGLHPHYVLEADRHGLRIPALRRFVSEGTYADGVIGVTPTITYPSHTTLMTGTSPSAHGILSNTTFDPDNLNRDGWYWYAQDIRDRTLWQAATEAGLSTASVNWPVTVGDRNIRFLLAEYWRTSTGDDLKLLRALSRPEGFQQQLEAKLGPFVDGNIDTVQSDEVRTRFALEILRRERPDFMAVHLIALDGTEHHEGPYTAPAYATLEQLDGMIDRLTQAALANDPAAVVAIVSDHGFIATHTAVNLRAQFARAGLLTLRASAPNTIPRVEHWDAQLWPAGASAAVMLRDPNDAATRAKVASLLDSLQSDERNGIARVLSGAALSATAGFPDAAFLIEFAPGFYFGSAWQGDLLTPAPYKGTHGYLPTRPEMHASFFVRGSGIRRGQSLGIIDMRQIAPTLARLLDVRLPAAREAPLAVRDNRGE